MALRFTILMDVNEERKIAMEYDPQILLRHLQLRVKEELVGQRSFFFQRFSKNEVKKALEKALLGLVAEFQGTIVEPIE